MALLPHDITPDMVEALSVDIARNPDFHKERARGIESLETFSEYIGRRMINLFGEDTPVARDVMALLAEVDYLSDRQAAGSELAEQVELPHAELLENLGNLSPAEQLVALDGYDAAAGNEVAA